MPNLREFDAGNLALRPSETGVEARAGTARRVGMFSNQLASAEDMLAAETNRLASETQNLGRETAGVGRQQEQLGAETAGVGRQQQQLGSETEREGSIKGQALDNIGRRAGSAIEVAGDMAVKYLDHQQISHGEKTFADMLLANTQAWNDTVKNADPNDPTVAQKFLQGLDDRIEKFKEGGFYTENAQQWADAKTAALRQHFVEKTTADMSTLAGQAAHVNTRQTINSLSATVHGDPSSLDFAMASLEHSTEAIISSSPNLTGAQAAQVRNEILQQGKESIVKSAAIGEIEKTARMPAWVTDPKYAPYVNGAELKQWEQAAKMQAKTNLLADNQAKRDAIQQAEQAVKVGSNKIMADNVSVDDNGRAMIKPQFFQQALNLARQHPDAPNAGETVRTLLNWGEHQQNQKAAPVVSDPGTKQDLTDRMFSADNPTTMVQIMKAEVDGKISQQDSVSLRRLQTQLNDEPLKGDVYKGAMNAAKDKLIVKMPGGAGKDVEGIANYSKFVQTFVPQYLSASRTGTLQPNALDTNDPKSLISQTMGQFKHTQGTLAATISAMGGVGQPPQPAAVTVKTPAEATALKPGTRYKTPDGREFVR